MNPNSVKHADGIPERTVLKMLILKKNQQPLKIIAKLRSMQSFKLFYGDRDSAGYDRLI